MAGHGLLSRGALKKTPCSRCLRRTGAKRSIVPAGLETVAGTFYTTITDGEAGVWVVPAGREVQGRGVREDEVQGRGVREDVARLLEAPDEVRVREVMVCPISQDDASVLSIHRKGYGAHVHTQHGNPPEHELREQEHTVCVQPPMDHCTPETDTSGVLVETTNNRCRRKHPHREPGHNRHGYGESGPLQAVRPQRSVADLC